MIKTNFLKILKSNKTFTSYSFFNFSDEYRGKKFTDKEAVAEKEYLKKQESNE